jgi:hypothetical protein
LPALSGKYGAAFDDVLERTYEPGDLVWRSPQSGENPADPGSWFQTRRTATAVGTESQSNIRKWGNPVDRLREYKFTKRITVYYGKVAGGKGYQVLFPKGMDPRDFLDYQGEVPLK